MTSDGAVSVSAVSCVCWLALGSWDSFLPPAPGDLGLNSPMVAFQRNDFQVLEKDKPEFVGDTHIYKGQRKDA